MLAKTTSCRLSDNCHPQAALPPVNTAKSGRCVIYSCGPKAQRRRVSSRAGALSFHPQLSSRPRTQEVLLLGSAGCVFAPELMLHRSHYPPSQSLSFPTAIHTREDKSRLRCVELRGPAHARVRQGGSHSAGAALALLGERATRCIILSPFLTRRISTFSLISCQPLWWQN